MALFQLKYALTLVLAMVICMLVRNLGNDLNRNEILTNKWISIKLNDSFKISGNCFCGNSYGSYGLAPNCDMACNANANEICGGSDANSIYSTQCPMSNLVLIKDSNNHYPYHGHVA